MKKKIQKEAGDRFVSGIWIRKARMRDCLVCKYVLKEN